VSTPASARQLRQLRKQLLVAESMLMRERLARALQRGLGPARTAMHAAALASAVLPLRPIVWALLSWFFGGRSKKSSDRDTPKKKEKNR